MEDRVSSLPKPEGLSQDVCADRSFSLELQNEEEIISAIDSINESLYSEVVQAKTEDLIPLLSNHDMSRISAIQSNDINEYFGFTDLDNI